MKRRNAQWMRIGTLLTGLLLPAALAAAPADPQRDPFWPPDFNPASATAGGAHEAAVKFNEVEWRGAERRLQETIKGTSRLPNKNGRIETLALINGRAIGVGEVVSLSLNGKLYRWKVVRVVLPGGPSFERLSGGGSGSSPAPVPAAAAAPLPEAPRTGSSE